MLQRDSGSNRKAWLSSLEVRQIRNADGLHAAWIILSCLWRSVGTQHSRFRCINGDTAYDQGDNDQCDNPRPFISHLFGMVKLSQVAHPYLFLPLKVRLFRANSPL
jgi:hypothetical protein